MSSAEGGADINPPFDRHGTLVQSLELQRQAAWDAARHDRELRDQLTGRIRFGLIVLNGVSLATVLNPASLLTGIPSAVLIFSAACFVVGVALAGLALESHQTHLISAVGERTSYAQKHDRAVILARHPPDSDEYDRLGKLFEEFEADTAKIHTPDQKSIGYQFGARGAWTAGIIAVLLGKFGVELSASLQAFGGWLGSLMIHG